MCTSAQLRRPRWRRRWCAAAGTARTAARRPPSGARRCPAPASPTAAAAAGKVVEAERDRRLPPVRWPARGRAGRAAAASAAAARARGCAGRDAQCLGGALDLPDQHLKVASSWDSASSSACPAAGCGAVPGGPGPSSPPAPSRGRGPGRVAPGRRPPIRPAWNGTSEAWPSRTYPRPGVAREMYAASGASITSALSAASVTRSAIRRLVLARMSADTTPEGRWVARIRCRPSERPRWAMPTSPVTKSGRSRASEANSSITITSRGSGR